MAIFNQDPLGQASVTTTLDDFSLLISGALPVRTHENTVEGASISYQAEEEVQTLPQKIWPAKKRYLQSRMPKNLSRLLDEN
jgi:hypothetical protein